MSSWSHLPTAEAYQPNLAPMEEDEPNDPVRIARNKWAVRHANASDSSDIIDSIDVDMVDATQHDNPGVYLVLDTNIFIQRLVVLKQALAHIKVSQSDLNVVMLVPGIVVSELDYLKNRGEGVGWDSRRASEWLASEIGSGRGQVKGQAYSQTMLLTGDWRKRRGLSNDELILDCCKYFTHVKRKDVLLCTSDNNLAVHAASNAESLFFRGESAVIRPPRGVWDCGQLLERATPGRASPGAEASWSCSFSKSVSPRESVSPKGSVSPQKSVTPTVAPIQASGTSRRKKRGGQGRTDTSSNSCPSSHPPSALHSIRPAQDDATMEVDLDIVPNDSYTALPGRGRNELHRHIAIQLAQYLRRLTGIAASVQQRRRIQESAHSPENATYTGKLPAENDWGHAWSLRACLTFMTKIQPPQPRSWIFDEAGASSLADFLGLPGERGARPGREWAKHDWARALVTVHNLAQDFAFKELDHHKMIEYEYAVLEAFAVD